MTSSRDSILRLGLLAEFDRRDAADRIQLRYGESLQPGDKIFVCEEKFGQAELEVVVEIDAAGLRWGRPTGQTRPCEVGLDD